MCLFYYDRICLVLQRLFDIFQIFEILFFLIFFYEKKYIYFYFLVFYYNVLKWYVKYILENVMVCLNNGSFRGSWKDFECIEKNENFLVQIMDGILNLQDEWVFLNGR